MIKKTIFYQFFFAFIFLFSLYASFCGIDTSDSPYHLFHYKNRVVDKMHLLTNLFGIWIVQIMQKLNMVYNTMIALRIVNWFTIFSPFIFLLFLVKNKSKWLVLSSLIVLALPTNWNTLCWDSWNRLFWFFFMFIHIKINEIDKKTIKPITLVIILIIGVLIKITNILLVFYLIFDIFYFNRYSTNEKKYLTSSLVCTIIIIGLLGFKYSQIISYLEVFDFVPEMDSNTHSLFSLIETNIRHFLIYAIAKIAVYVSTRKNALESREGIIIFLSIVLFISSFNHTTNSIVAFLFIFTYFEFILYLMKIQYLELRIGFIFLFSPLLYTAGTDIGMYKAYWVIPQNLGLLFFYRFYHVNTIVFKNDAFKLVSFSFVFLSVAIFMNTELYKSDKITNCNKTLNFAGFSRIRTSYWQKQNLIDQKSYLMRNWDPKNPNILLGAGSFLSLCDLSFASQNTNKNFIGLLSIHGNLDNTDQVKKLIDVVRKKKEFKNSANIFLFGRGTLDSSIYRNYYYYGKTEKLKLTVIDSRYGVTVLQIKKAIND